VGGDYYDFIPFPDGMLGVIVADVAGKGMPASLIMTGMHARVHALFEEESTDLAGKITRLNRQTCGNTPENRFITFFMSVIHPQTGEITYCNAGHNPTMLVRKTGSYDMLSEGGLILGIMPKFVYKSAAAKMETGDVLVFYTDGVTEAVDLKDEDFGEERLARLVSTMRDRPAQEIVEAIHKAVTDFVQGGPQADDITVVVARKLE
jgi:phosphoserine phosphatase RsbU/P